MVSFSAGGAAILFELVREDRRQEYVAMRLLARLNARWAAAEESSPAAVKLEGYRARTYVVEVLPCGGAALVEVLPDCVTTDGLKADAHRRRERAQSRVFDYLCGEPKKLLRLATSTSRTTSRSCTQSAWAL